MFPRCYRVAPKNATNVVLSRFLRVALIGVKKAKKSSPSKQSDLLKNDQLGGLFLYDFGVIVRDRGRLNLAYYSAVGTLDLHDPVVGKHTDELSKNLIVNPALVAGDGPIGELGVAVGGFEVETLQEV